MKPSHCLSDFKKIVSNNLSFMKKLERNAYNHNLVNATNNFRTYVPMHVISKHSFIKEIINLAKMNDIPEILIKNNFLRIKLLVSHLEEKKENEGEENKKEEKEEEAKNEEKKEDDLKQANIVSYINCGDSYNKDLQELIFKYNEEAIISSLKIEYNLLYAATTKEQKKIYLKLTQKEKS